MGGLCVFKKSVDSVQALAALVPAVFSQCSKLHVQAPTGTFGALDLKPNQLVWATLYDILPKLFNSNLCSCNVIATFLYSSRGQDENKIIWFLVRPADKQETQYMRSETQDTR